MDINLVSTLKATGFVSREQLTHWVPLGADMTLEPWMIQTHDGLWDRARFQRGRHIAHWTLMTAVFLALADQLEHWSVDAQDDIWGVNPDALLRIQSLDFPIALEADTGKETASQWSDKLMRYAATPLDWRILVVAQGKILRLQRLAGWLTVNAPRSWMLLPYSVLEQSWCWSWTDPVVETFPSAAASLPRQTTYRWQGGDIDPARVQQELQNGRWHIGGVERQHRRDIVHLAKR